MNKTDDFDKYLKSSFQKLDFKIADEGFTEKVLTNLPTNRFSSINKNFILFFSGALSGLIFIISNGYKSILIAVSDILSNGFQLIRPSLISIFVVTVFISVSFYIARIGYNKSLI